MFNHLRTLATRQLHKLKDDVRLVIVHPNFVQQHTILAEILNDSVVYLRLNGQELSYTDVDSQFHNALAMQDRDDLSEVSTLILDECDRATTQALEQFLPEAVNSLKQGRILLFTRHIPDAILSNPLLRNHAAFIPDDPSIMLWDYAQRNEDTALLEVRSFGDGRVLLNGRSVDNWDGILPRSLFFYIVDRGMTTRNEIFETFWPNLTKREATNVFHVTKRKISEVLGIDLTTYWSGFYRISPNIHLSYDVVLFTEMVQNGAVASLEEADNMLTRAITLYQGQFLSKMDMAWTRKRREELNQDYSEALASLAQVKADLGHKETALNLYLQAALHSRYREDLAASIMELYSEMGMPHQALAVYDRLAAELQNELGVTPAHHLQEMAGNLR